MTSTNPSKFRCRSYSFHIWLIWCPGALAAKRPWVWIWAHHCGQLFSIWVVFSEEHVFTAWVPLTSIKYLDGHITSGASNITANTRRKCRVHTTLLRHPRELNKLAPLPLPWSSGTIFWTGTSSFVRFLVWIYSLPRVFGSFQRRNRPNLIDHIQQVIQVVPWSFHRMSSWAAIKRLAWTSSAPVTPLTTAHGSLAAVPHGGRDKRGGLARVALPLLHDIQILIFHSEASIHGMCR